MNVCSLDAITRTPDFESIAGALELRGWEWDLLHAADGETTLGEIVRRMGIDQDSAIGFVHEAIHRGLLGITTMSLEAYRSHAPMQTAIAAPPATLSLATSATTPPVTTVPHEEETLEPTGSISFSSDAFDWNAPEQAFEEPAEDVAPASEHAPEPEPEPEPEHEPVKTVTAHVGAVHYDDRFGVEHADGPFATHDAPKSGIGAVAATAVAASAAAFAGAAAVVTAVASPEKAHAETVEDPFAVAPPRDEPVAPTVAAEFTPVEDPFAAAPGVVEDPFAPHAHNEEVVAETSHEAAAEPFADVAHEDEPFGSATHDVEDPFAVVAHHDEPPVAATSHDAVVEPFAEIAHHDEPIAEAPSHEAIAEPETFAHHEAFITDTPSANGHATIEPERAEESAPGSISFSFSPDDPIDAIEPIEAAPHGGEPHVVHANESVASPMFADVEPMAIVAPSLPQAETIEHHDNVLVASDRLGETQSTFYEREAVDTDAAREMEAKAKTWKESLSWREQQELNDAMETGKEKQSVIGSLLRSLGIR